MLISYKRLWAPEEDTTKESQSLLCEVMSDNRAVTVSWQAGDLQVIIGSSQPKLQIKPSSKSWGLMVLILVLCKLHSMNVQFYLIVAYFTMKVSGKQCVPLPALKHGLYVCMYMC